MRRWVLGLALLLTAAVGTTWSVVSAQDDRRDADTEEEDVVPQGPRIERELRIFGDREAHIGVSIRDVENTASASGAQVEDVREDSPAAKAGIQDGDVITEFDGERVRSARHLSRLVSETPPGRTVAMKVLRDGRQVESKVTPEAGTAFSGRFEHPDIHIERMPRPGPPLLEWLPDAHGRGRTQGRLGVSVQALTGQLAEYFGAENGLLVTTVRDDSPAAAAGLKAGDVITAVDGKSVSSPTELADAVRQTENEELKISYVRDRKAAEAGVKIPVRERPRRSARPA